MIKLENVSFSYGNTPALRNVSIEETEPIIMGLWGRNGSGKTTFMKLLAGMENIDAGRINVSGLPHIIIQKQCTISLIYKKIIHSLFFGMSKMPYISVHYLIKTGMQI
ncbi:ATP-binding cassette domain-containing protein [Niallia circulans]